MEKIGSKRQVISWLEHKAGIMMLVIAGGVMGVAVAVKVGLFTIWVLMSAGVAIGFYWRKK